jgi:hypothetical protein
MTWREQLLAPYHVIARVLLRFMSIADVIRIFHFRKTMRYISLFCLVTYVQILHAVLHR